MSFKHNTASFYSKPLDSFPSESMARCSLHYWEVGWDLHGPAGPTGVQGRRPIKQEAPPEVALSPHCLTLAECCLAALAQGFVLKSTALGLSLHRPGMGQGTHILNNLSVVARGHSSEASSLIRSFIEHTPSTHCLPGPVLGAGGLLGKERDGAS